MKKSKFDVSRSPQLARPRLFVIRVTDARPANELTRTRFISDWGMGFVTVHKPVDAFIATERDADKVVRYLNAAKRAGAINGGDDLTFEKVEIKITAVEPAQLGVIAVA